MGGLGSGTLWLSKPLTFVQVLHVLRELLQCKGFLSGGCAHPAISVDAPYIAKDNHGKSFGPLGAVTFIAQEFSRDFLMKKT